MYDELDSPGSAATQQSNNDRDNDGRFTVASTETVYHGAIFNVRIDHVTMPGGAVARREMVEHMGAVAVAAIDENNNIYLIEQYRHPLRRRLWELPAGLLDIAGEDPLTGAQRELVEEVSIAADEWSVLVDLASSPGFSTEVIRVYLARGLREVTAPARIEEEADLRIVKVPLETAVAAVMDGRIVNGIAVAGILAAARALDTGAGPGTADTTATLRPATGAWHDSNAIVNESANIGGAPDLHPAS